MANRYSDDRSLDGRARLLGAAVVAAGLLAGSPALAQPVYKDLERFGPAPIGVPLRPLVALPPALVLDPDAIGRPPRLVTGGPGYVGSDYGLGKPSFTGLGSRPDWGR